MKIVAENLAICTGSCESLFFVTLEGFQISPKFTSKTKAQSWMSEYLNRAKKEGLIRD